METAPTLTALAQSSAAVYLDNCMLSADRNFRADKSSHSHRRYAPDLGEIIGKAWRFADVRYPLLYRQRQQSQRILSALIGSPSIRTTPAIWEEHAVLLDHLRYKLTYLRKYS